MKEKIPSEKEITTAHPRRRVSVVGVGLVCAAMVMTGGCSAEKLVENNAVGQSVEAKSEAQRNDSREVRPTGIHPVVVVHRLKGHHLNVRRVKGYLEKICKIGRRQSGSQGMAEQQKLIADHFIKFGAKVRFQRFGMTHPLTGKPVRLANMIVSWHPQTQERVLLACHYDTRPFPDMDRRNPRGVFIGANDGASGVALFMELAHQMKKIKPKYGVDFVFFDAEELVYSQKIRGETVTRGKYFVGSEYFAKDYRDKPPRHRYHFGVVVDMVADRNLNLYLERNSMKFAPKVTISLWKTAAELGVREFRQRDKYDVQDDHLALNSIARIPTCDIIDFDYPQWHTTFDVPSKCSGSSMAKVGRVLLSWLENPPKP